MTAKRDRQTDRIAANDPAANLHGPGWIRTSDLSVMPPTSAFAAPFGFVVWTIPSPKLRVPSWVLAV